MASSSTSHHFMLLLICVSTLSIIGISHAYGGDQSSQTLPISPIIATAANGGITCPVPQNQCGSECGRRCSATSHKKPCLFFCNKCCNTCLCVPPGTYGNKECCPCYNNWKTKEGGPKCP